MKTLSQQILDFLSTHKSFNLRHLKSAHKDLYHAILNHPYQIENFQEKAYWISYQIREIPKCPICGKPRPFYNFSEGYSKYCSKECGKKGWKIKKEQTCLERYGASSPLGSTKIRKQINQTNLEKYGSKGPIHSEIVKEKVKLTNLKRYGVENPGQSKELMKKASKTKEDRFGKEWGKEINKKAQITNLERYGARTTFQFAKDRIEKTNLNRYGSASVFGSPKIKEKIKQTFLQRYGVESVFLLPDIQKRMHKTAKISKEEQKVLELLETKFSLIESQYFSEKYPWFCDFYIPEKELYIECNFHWTHGGRPFILEQCKNQLNIWIEKSEVSDFYKNALCTWTIRDVKKRNRAKSLKLNWIEFFSFKECKNWLNGFANL